MHRRALIVSLAAFSALAAVEMGLAAADVPHRPGGVAAAMEHLVAAGANTTQPVPARTVDQRR